ncbi:MAG: hypothetical protein KGJ06_07610, partial [Pseudomonadota bacterium]|nr:hypothetical protein [Pseudomonadota bacterium]
GVAESYSGGDLQEIYDDTMEDIRAVYPPEAYYHHRYENILSNRSDAFYQQLPLYSIKPLYTGGIWLLHALGIPMAKATWVLSILGFLGIGLVCFLFIPGKMDAAAWWAVAGVFSAVNPWPVTVVAALSTPDTLCIAFSLAACCLWIYRRSFPGFALCFILAQLARPDTLLLSVALTLFFTFAADDGYRLTRRQGLGFAAAAVLLYLIVNALAGNYGWKSLFFYTFIHRTRYPADTEAVFGLGRYLDIVRHGFGHIFHNGRLQWLLIASLAVSFTHWRTRPGSAMFVLLLWVVWNVFLVRFSIFPAWWEDRYYYPYYFIILYAIAEIALPCLPALENSIKSFAETEKLRYTGEP